MAPTLQTMTVLLIFFLLYEAEVSHGQKHDCKRLDKLEYCRNNSRILVTKTKQDYILRLCSGSLCMSDIAGNSNLRIRCKDVCDVCKSLPGQNDCSKDETCEEQVDKYLNDYCVSARTVGSAPQSIEIIAGASTGPPKVASQSFTSGQTEMKRTSTSGSVAALAVLFSLCVVLLAAVTTGWAWTCWNMKKKVQEKSPSAKSTAIYDSATYRMPSVVNKDKNTNDGGDEEIYFKNPTYEGNSNQSGIRPVPYDTVELSSQTATVVEDGKMYAVPDNHWQAHAGTYIF